MIRIEFEFKTAQEARLELIEFAAALAAPALPGPASKIIEGLKDAVAHAQDAPSEVVLRDIAQETVDGLKSFSDHIAGKPTDGVVTVVEAPRRGRPRKAQNALSVEHTPNAQPAVATNTGSSAAVSSPPAAEQAGTAAVATTPEPSPGATAPASFTADQVRAKLQEFLQKPGGDAGMELASKVLGQFGFAKVKQINDAPQHWAAIVASVDAEMAKL